MIAHDIIAKLEKKYAPPSWAFFTEVKSSVGFGNRRADGIAFGMWRSIGLQVQGFEVKVDRADWLREIKDASKSDEIFRYCDRWWVVTGEKEIIQPGELPDTWGHMQLTGNGFKVVVKAPKLTPDPLTREFVAEILRRQFDSSRRPENLQLEYSRGFENGKAAATPHDLKYEVELSKKLRKAIDEFEKKSGIQIQEWSAGDVGKAVRAVLDCGAEKVKEDLQYALGTIERTAEQIKKAMEAL